VFGVQKCGNVLEEHTNEASSECEIMLCRCLVIHKFKCTKCSQACHWACHRGLVLEVKDKPPLAALPEGSICCTEKCHQLLIKDASNSQRGDWKTDGKPETPNMTSIKLLLDWWLDCPEHEV